MKSNSPTIRSLVPALAAACLLSRDPAHGQRVLVPHDEPHALVALVDLRSGALVDGDWIDVQGTAIPTPSASSLRDAERVRGEVWVGGGLVVYRYDASTRQFLGSFPVNAPLRSIEAQSRRVLVTTADAIEAFDFDGTPTGILPIFGAGDTLELRDSMLVAIQDESRVDRYTLDGQLIGAFAGPTIPTPLGVLSKPQQLSLRGNGNVLVCGDVRVYELTEFGEFIAEYDAGPFEGGVVETLSGRLFIPLGNGVALHDAETRTTTRVGGLFFGKGRKVGRFDTGAPGTLAAGDPASQVTCAGGQTSNARVPRLGFLGSPFLDDRLVSAFGDRLPTGVPVRLALGLETGRRPFGGGTLCLDGATATILPFVEFADETGQVVFPLIRGPEATILFDPGSTWHMQLLVRDAGTLVVSDAARITFGS